MNNIQDFLFSNNLTLINKFDFEDEERCKINSKNKTFISYILSCGHVKELTISSLSSSKYNPKNCLICKRNEKNTIFKYDTKTISCDKCSTIYRLISGKNNNSYSCMICKNENSAESKLYLNLFNKFEIYRNIKIDKFNFDFAIYEENKIVLLIELDNYKHNNKKIHDKHIEKDYFVLSNDLKMLRIHEETIDSFIEISENYINERIKNDEYQIYLYKGSTNREKIFSSTFYKQFEESDESTENEEI